MASIATPRSGSGDRLRRHNSAGSRDRRAMTSRTSSRRKSTPLDRLAMLLMEANEISQCLQKHYTFEKEGDTDGDDPDASVKVINHKLGISCVWPVTKLKERLIRMRRLVYQPDTETSSLSADAVFFDPSDHWVKEGSADYHRDADTPPSISGSRSSTCVSPVSGHGRKMHSETDALPRPFDDGSQKAAEREAQEKDPCGSAIPKAGLQLRRTRSELPADSESLPGESIRSCMSPSPPPSDTDTTSTAILPERYLTGTGLKLTLPRKNVHGDLNEDGKRGRSTSLQRGRVLKQDSKEEKIREKYSYNSSHGRSGNGMVNGHGKYNGEGMVNGKGMEEGVKVHVEQADRTCQTILPPTTPALTMCRHLVESIRDRLHNGPDKETLLEKVLYNCECIKEAVINILEAHAQGRDSQHGVDSWSDNDLMRTSAFYLVSALENLTSHFTCWVTSLPVSALAESFGSSTSSQPPSRLGCDACAMSREGVCEEHAPEPENHLLNAQVVTGAILHSLALDLAILLQFAEQNDDSEVHDTASRVFDHIYDLCRRCGELSIATDEQPKILWNTERESLEDLMTFQTRNKNDPFRPSPGCDMKQSFLSGSDVTVDRALKETLQTAADLEKQVRALSCHKDTDESSEDILKHTYVVVATTKVLIQRTLKVQTELGVTVREEPEQPDSHYNAHYTRSVSVLTHASQLSDALTLMGQACTAMVNDGDPSGMRKIGRCGEIVLKSCCRLAAIPGITGEPNELGGRPRSTTPSSNLNGLLSPRVKGKLCVSLSIDNKSDNPLVAILLSPTQIDGLERSVTDVNTAIMSLLNAIQCHLPSDLSSSRSRRMLPVVPARALGRSNSAKQAPSSRRKLTRDLTNMQVRRAHEV